MNPIDLGQFRLNQRAGVNLRGNNPQVSHAKAPQRSLCCSPDGEKRCNLPGATVDGTGDSVIVRTLQDRVRGQLEPLSEATIFGLPRSAAARRSQFSGG